MKGGKEQVEESFNDENQVGRENIGDEEIDQEGDGKVGGDQVGEVYRTKDDNTLVTYEKGGHQINVQASRLDTDILAVRDQYRCQLINQFKNCDYKRPPKNEPSRLPDKCPLFVEDSHSDTTEYSSMFSETTFNSQTTGGEGIVWDSDESVYVYLLIFKFTANFIHLRFFL